MAPLRWECPIHGAEAAPKVLRLGSSQERTRWASTAPDSPNSQFAGVGVLIPKFSGDQYNTGRKIPPSQAKRGDLNFYGSGGTQHVAM
ncbi:MAG: peptidoglycan DL-endopeptidase RipB [Mycobacterium sp.]|nr:peptidoglycan DL-endopeptidase RipB [Mycobacterium sp.]